MATTKATEALITAVLERNVEAAQEAITAEADVNVKSRVRDGFTPLHLAAEGGDERMAQLLIDNGANVNAKHKLHGTPLHAAAGGQHIKVVRLLIDKGADRNAKDINGHTPLDHAASFPLVRGHRTDTMMLLERLATDEKSHADCLGGRAKGEKRGLS
jgi:ankyrin repeat protein